VESGTDAFDARTALFLAGANVVVEALGDRLVMERWDGPSVLEDQRVSGVAGHLARGGVWVVADYLEKGVPDRPVDYESPAAYFAAVVTSANDETHRAVRARAADVASVGQTELLTTLRARISGLEAALGALSPTTRIEVIGGGVMHLGDYLATRIVEQCVHLDDLARSVGRQPWLLPDDHREVAISVGIEIAERLHGKDAVLRALYRRGFAATTFPSL
jgi:hypothetical protein